MFMAHSYELHERHLREKMLQPIAQKRREHYRFNCDVTQCLEESTTAGDKN